MALALGADHQPRSRRHRRGAGGRARPAGAAAAARGGPSGLPGVVRGRVPAGHRRRRHGHAVHRPPLLLRVRSPCSMRSRACDAASPPWRPPAPARASWTGWPPRLPEGRGTRCVGHPLPARALLRGGGSQGPCRHAIGAEGVSVNPDCGLNPWLAETEAALDSSRGRRGVRAHGARAGGDSPRGRAQA
ncbi:hypothetical protein QJS66_11940 [Kocuria rhizophila]|nr:hypothetical protein QJS66_11940 [Kocuria rhizophila]